MKFILVISAILMSSVALAAKPYGMAGCGWGSQMMGKEGNQILAATTNGTSGTQTFGISSGTSNCVTASEQTAMIKNYIEANYASLVTDMAKGQGDTLNTLSKFYGCDTDAFATEMKSNYEMITPAKENATHVMVNVNKVIEDSASLNSTCTHAL
ncbi:DUF3015 family protein [Peredibacter sp. HCB2-198]|uniref:DUF3015 family protein n=1 Tax=Peredibacter sp. HCB2-198 TaxID=3383025 RepID=UPI0038B4BE0F